MFYIVSTPIGNLADMTKRAVDTLNSVDLIACEDTRHTRTLLDHYGIKTQTVSYHQHSTLQKIDWLLSELRAGKDIALVTDAGTPGISDPGGVLVSRVHEYNAQAKIPIDLFSIPGPSSLTAALSLCGFPTDTFLFLGFLPKKKGRQSLLRSLTKTDKALGIKTIAFFESALRIEKTLQDFEAAFSLSSPAGSPGAKQDRGSSIQVCLCRELTKKFEETWRGTLSQAIEKTKTPHKGEFVVVISLA